jgi:hypothetical protein
MTGQSWMTNQSGLTEMTRQASGPNGSKQTRTGETDAAGP